MKLQGILIVLLTGFTVGCTNPKQDSSPKGILSSSLDGIYSVPSDCADNGGKGSPSFSLPDIKSGVSDRSDLSTFTTLGIPAGTRLKVGKNQLGGVSIETSVPGLAQNTHTLVFKKENLKLRGLPGGSIYTLRSGNNPILPRFSSKEVIQKVGQKKERSLALSLTKDGDLKVEQRLKEGNTVSADDVCILSKN